MFTLFGHDTQLLTLPPSVDKTFHLISEIIFLFFVTELALLSLFQENFLGSFYFYLDLISILSMIPEVHFIWVLITSAMTGTNSNDESLNAILANSHLAKASRASQAGSK